MVWCRVQRPKLDAFDRQRRHVKPIAIVKMDLPVCKVNAKHDALPIASVTATSDVRAAFASHCVVVMMIVVMVKCVKTLSVRLDVDRIHIAQEIWRASPKNVLIHVKSQPRAVQMPIVLFKIMLKLAFVQNIWLVILISVANMHRRHAQRTTNAHRIIHALPMFAKQTAIMIKIVCLMNDACEEHVDRFVTLTALVERVKSVRIDCVKLAAEMI